METWQMRGYDTPANHCKFNLSGRAYDRILKLSRTIADPDNSSKIETKHILDAIQYRNSDRQN